MKIKTILMMTGVAAVITTSAMANEPYVGKSRVVEKGPDIVVSTDRYGNVSKDEFLSYQAKRYDEASANSRNGTVLNAEGRVVTKGEFLAEQSAKFDDMDTMKTGEISKIDFEASEIVLMEPAAGGPEESTSRPQAYNQAVPTGHISGGADGAGGWTAQ